MNIFLRIFLAYVGHTALFIAFICASADVGHARKRVALIIGNSDYAVSRLANPIQDANAMAEALRALEFDVILRINADQASMGEAIRRFAGKLSRDSVGLFYFSGHGMQHGGSNYLIPIGSMAEVLVADHLQYKAVDAGYVLSIMTEAQNGLNIVILDACRNNPWKSFSKSLGRGLARLSVSNAEGVLIAYATSPNKVAYDGAGNYSPYTKHLLEVIREPGVPVELMLKKVRRRVKAETNGEQVPWYEASIDGDFYFNTKVESSPPPAPSPYVFSRQFSGKIGKTMAVKMTLRSDGKNVVGSYYYVKHRNTIALRGTIDSRGNFEMKGVYGSEWIDVFIGRVGTNGKLRGTWKNPSGTKSFPFAVE